MFWAINAFQTGAEWDLKFGFTKSNACCSSSEIFFNLIICVEFRFMEMTDLVFHVLRSQVIQPF